MAIRALGILLSPQDQKPLYNQWYEQVRDEEPELLEAYHPIDRVIRVKSGKGIMLETPLFSAFAWTHSPLANYFLELCANASEIPQLFILPIEDKKFDLAEDDELIGVYSLKSQGVYEFGRKIVTKAVEKHRKVATPRGGGSETF